MEVDKSVPKFSRQDLEILKSVHVGGTSAVHIAMLKQVSVTAPNTVAVKIYRDGHQRYAENEIKYLQRFSNHRNVVTFQGIVLDKPLPLIIMEWANCSLKEYIDEMRRKHVLLTKEALYMCIIQVARGIEYMHDHCVAHLDIKPSNILITKSEDTRVTLKLCDFGISEDVQPYEMKSRKVKGTYAYMAPEIYTSETFCMASDIFSFSFVIWGIATCKELPFEGMPSSEIMLKVGKKCKRPDLRVVSLTQRLRNVLEECWQHDSRNRWNIKRIISHLGKETLLTFIQIWCQRNTTN